MRPYFLGLAGGMVALGLSGAPTPAAADARLVSGLPGIAASPLAGDAVTRHDVGYRRGRVYRRYGYPGYHAYGGYRPYYAYPRFRYRGYRYYRPYYGGYYGYPGRYHYRRFHFNSP